MDARLGTETSITYALPGREPVELTNVLIPSLWSGSTFSPASQLGPWHSGRWRQVQDPTTDH